MLVKVGECRTRDEGDQLYVVALVESEILHLAGIDCACKLAGNRVDGFAGRSHLYDIGGGADLQPHINGQAGAGG